MNVLTGVNYIIIEIKIQDIYFLTLTYKKGMAREACDVYERRNSITRVF